jgi:hypothetical protein|tara:strand:- start:1693 stop:1830 length:138 start_codon:yes stop_codon:yes gene_type:complete
MVEEWTDKNGDIYRWDADSNRYLLQKKAKAPAKKKTSKAKKEKKA